LSIENAPKQLFLKTLEKRVFGPDPLRTFAQLAGWEDDLNGQARLTSPLSASMQWTGLEPRDRFISRAKAILSCEFPVLVQNMAHFWGTSR
jgi:hypothetical protein